MVDDVGYINGFVERKSDGRYEGQLRVDGVNLSPIEGVYFEREEKTYLWIKRKLIMEYDFESGSYRTRKRTPAFECYLEKTPENGSSCYKGEFFFLRFRYSVVGYWDRILGIDKQRLNLFVERMPMQEQTILKSINERKRSKCEK